MDGGTDSPGRTDSDRRTSTGDVVDEDSQVSTTRMSTHYHVPTFRDTTDTGGRSCGHDGTTTVGHTERSDTTTDPPDGGRDSTNDSCTIRTTGFGTDSDCPPVPTPDPLSSTYHGATTTTLEVSVDDPVHVPRRVTIVPGSGRTTSGSCSRSCRSWTRDGYPVWTRVVDSDPTGTEGGRWRRTSHPYGRVTSSRTVP